MLLYLLLRQVGKTCGLSQRSRNKGGCAFTLLPTFFLSISIFHAHWSSPIPAGISLSTHSILSTQFQALPPTLPYPRIVAALAMFYGHNPIDFWLCWLPPLRHCRCMVLYCCIQIQELHCWTPVLRSKSYASAPWSRSSAALWDPGAQLSSCPVSTNELQDSRSSAATEMLTSVAVLDEMVSILRFPFPD